MELDHHKNEYLLRAFQSILENSPDLIFIKDRDLKYISASRAFAQLVNTDFETGFLGRTDFDFFHQELAEQYTKDDRRVLESGIPIINHVEPLPDENGWKRYSSTSKYVIYGSNGEIIGIYGLGRDVTAQIELEEERESRELSRQMFEGVLEADLSENKVLHVEGTEWAKSLGLLKQSSFSSLAETLAQRFIHEDYAQEFREFYCLDRLVASYHNGVKEFSTITYQSVNGKDYKWVEFKSRLYYSKISDSLRITTVINDLDDEIRSRERLKQKAEIDALTGLLNRESTVEQIKELLNSGDEQTHALLFLDLDSFKQVNDSLGHPCGDKVLRKIAERLKQVFCHQEIIGRIGGDEFLVLLKNVSSQEEAEARASRIFDVVPFYQFAGDKEIFVTCSVGATLTGGKSLDQLYAEADKAMYRAKESGKNQMIFY